MNKEEVYKLIFVTKSVYPQVYSKFTGADFDNMALAWHMAFEDFDYNAISLALKAYITTNPSGFPPVPAQLIQIATQKSPKKEMSSNEAWGLVFKAIQNGLYGYKEEYEKLPELCQKAIGSPESLRELANLDTSTVISVEGSHFKRNYEALVKRQKEYDKIPESTRVLLESTGESLLEIKE